MKHEYQPFYNVNISYTDNYRNGPFGPFARLPEYIQRLSERIDFFGHPVDLPFGIPAGPLLNGNYVRAAVDWGFAVNTYKTVRSVDHPAHEAPNIVRVVTDRGNIKPGDTVRGDSDMEHMDITRDGITNSFGVPSQPPSVWQEDVRQTNASMPEGSVMILSFMGTKNREMTFDQYVADYVLAARLAAETASPVLEVNLSCPNVGREGLLCYDIQRSAAILEAIKGTIGNTPLLVKIGYFGPSEHSKLETLLEAIHRNSDGVVAINTIQAKVTDEDGKQFLPGSSMRLFSGICGAKIRWAGLEMAEKIVSYKQQKGWRDFCVVGVGGVVTADDYLEYRNRGVDIVQSATGAMWNPNLANEIRSRLLGAN